MDGSCTAMMDSRRNDENDKGLKYVSGYSILAESYHVDGYYYY